VAAKLRELLVVRPLSRAAGKEQEPHLVPLRSYAQMPL